MTCLELQRGKTALMMAARYGYAGISEMLLRSGADVNAKNTVSICGGCRVLCCHRLLPAHNLVLPGCGLCPWLYDGFFLNCFCCRFVVHDVPCTCVLVCARVRGLKCICVLFCALMRVCARARKVLLPVRRCDDVRRNV